MEIRVVSCRTSFSARKACDFYMVWNVVCGSMYCNDTRVGDILRSWNRALVKVTFPRSKWYLVKLKTEKCGEDGSMVK